MRFLILILMLVLGSPLCALFPQQTTETAASQKKEPGILEGKAINALTGEPVLRATVTVRPVAQKTNPADAPGGYAMETDENGTFHFEKLEPGKYQVTATKVGYLRSEYGARRTKAPGVPVTLQAGQTLSNIDIKLSPQAVLSGTVTDDHGEPMPSCTALLIKRGWMRGRNGLMIRGSGRTDMEGAFKIGEVSPGKYYIQANCQFRNVSENPPQTVDRQGNPVKAQLVSTFYGDTSTPEGASVIQVQSGQNVNSLNIRLHREPVFQVHGKVVSVPAGRSPMNYYIYLRSRTMLDFYFVGMATQPDKSGEFKLQNIQPGAYQLLLSESGNMGSAVQFPFDVTGDIDNLEVSIPPPSDLQGRIRLEGQASSELSAINLSLWNPSGMSMTSATVQPDGSFTFRNVAPERYELSMRFPGEDAFIKSVRVGRKESSEPVVDLTQDNGPVEVTVSLGPAKLDGSVTRESPDSSQQAIPASAVNVAIVPEVPTEEMNGGVRIIPTDDQGRFSAKSLKPGKYRVFSAEGVDAEQWSDPELQKALEAYGAEVEVAEKDSKQVQLKLIPESTVSQIVEKLGL